MDVEDDYAKYDKSLDKSMVYGRNHRVCAVRSCHNPQGIYQKQIDFIAVNRIIMIIFYPICTPFLPGSKYYSFPRNPALKKIWVERSSRPNVFKETTRPTMCQRHFVKEDFLPDKIGGKTGKMITRRLDRNRAIPTRNLEKKFDPVKIILQVESKNKTANFGDEDDDDEIEDTVSQNIRNENR